MKLGVLGVSFGKDLSIDLDFIRRAESLGFDSTWTAEAYGNDAVSCAAWILAQTMRIRVGTAIMQMPARTPAMTAMTAMSLDQLSGGRFILGLGASGPQVVEGWHGVPYGRPLTRTREYVAILRKIFVREAPLTFEGHHYRIPLTGEGTTGLGKPLKSILHGNPSLPIYTAAVSPKGLACAAEVADGVLPLWMNPDRFDLIGAHLEAGFAKAGGGKSLQHFAVCPSVSVVIADDLGQARAPIKLQLALYIGGMGARDKNFYNDYAARLGYAEEAERIQTLFLGGKKAEAVAAVPDGLVDDLSLIGPAGRIRERLSAWKQAGRRREVDTLLVAARQPEALELLASELL